MYLINEDGQGMVEYILIIAVIAMTALLAFKYLGVSVKKTACRVAYPGVFDDVDG